MIGPNPNSEAAGRPKGKGEASATKQKKPALRLACLVDYTGKISNLIRALLALESFSNSIRVSFPDLG